MEQSGVDGVDNPQTVTTTRSTAVLKIEEPML